MYLRFSGECNVESTVDEAFWVIRAARTYVCTHVCMYACRYDCEYTSIHGMYISYACVYIYNFDLHENEHVYV
jgi:hypothetical protein